MQQQPQTSLIEIPADIKASDIEIKTSVVKDGDDKVIHEEKYVSINKTVENKLTEQMAKDQLQQLNTIKGKLVEQLTITNEQIIAIQVVIDGFAEDTAPVENPK
jgi:hypothetical protein